MSKSFSKQVEEWGDRAKEALVAVTRQSVQDVINEAQLREADGGRMRVDTGFLRASGQSSINQMPYGPSVRFLHEKNSYPSPDDYTGEGGVASDIAKLQLGDVFYFGWTANYAAAREAKDGFLNTPLQRWQEIVDKNVSNYNRRSGK